MFNYAILARVLEIFLSNSRDKLMTELNSCNKFYFLLETTKIKVNQAKLSCTTIFKRMLKLDSVHLLSDVLEEHN